MKLPLKNCADNDAFIEIGLRASPAKEKPNGTPKTKGNNNDDVKDQMVMLM